MVCHLLSAGLVKPRGCILLRSPALTPRFRPSCSSRMPPCQLLEVGGRCLGSEHHEVTSVWVFTQRLRVQYCVQGVNIWNNMTGSHRPFASSKSWRPRSTAARAPAPCSLPAPCASPFCRGRSRCVPGPPRRLPAVRRLRGSGRQTAGSGELCRLARASRELAGWRYQPARRPAGPPARLQCRNAALSGPAVNREQRLSGGGLFHNSLGPVFRPRSLCQTAGKSAGTKGARTQSSQVCVASQRRPHCPCRSFEKWARGGGPLARHPRLGRVVAGHACTARTGRFNAAPALAAKL